jgi:hypothetical protein
MASPDGINQNLLLLLHGLGDTPAAYTGEKCDTVKVVTAAAVLRWQSCCLLAGRGLEGGGSQPL